MKRMEENEKKTKEMKKNKVNRKADEKKIG